MKTLLFAMIWLNSGLAIAQQKSKPLNDVESILDQLEKRLKDSEIDVIKSPGSKNTTTSSGTALKFKSKTIEANVGGSQNLLTISEALGRLEDDIDQIDAEVHLTRQSILESAKMDNMIEIEGIIEDPDKTALRSLTVSIDGYQVYILNDSNGLWVPSRSIPIYSGPMSPGRHKVVIESRVSSKKKDHFPYVHADSRVIKKSINIDVPEGQYKKSWSVDLASTSTKTYAQVAEPKLDESQEDKEKAVE